jgi:hypothetical protein
MPYVFPYENVFMGGIAILIVALLILRVRLVRQRRLREESEASMAPLTGREKGTPPLV